MVFHISTPWYPKAHLKVSHLCYASIKQPQYEATVKLLGSFRLTAGRGHLHPHCIFTEQVLETVSQSLRLSCTSELTRQGIALFYSYARRTLSSSVHLSMTRTRDIWSLCGHVADYAYISARKVASAFICLTYNRSSPSAHVSKKRAHYLRTIIVIADIDRGLHSPAVQINPYHLPCLTFRHWSGVTFYTLTYVFAESCVFVKQSPGNLSLRPRLLAEKGQALSRSYGRFFAEFLKDPSLVRLGLLDLTTCVGLRYGTISFNLRSFSWKRAPQICSAEASHSDPTRMMHGGFANHASS
jgi:hypothetical protein